MSEIYWTISFAPILISFVLLAMLGITRSGVYKNKLWLAELTAKEALLGKVALILFISGVGLFAVGMLFELLFHK
jgi:hypothetical protein